jgi:hypothetical protein
MPRLDYYIRIILSFFFPLEIIISYIVLHGMFLILLFLFFCFSCYKLIFYHLLLLDI